MNAESTYSTEMDEVVRQGFLCPFCMQDLGNLSLLYAHVRKFHPESSEDTDTLEQLKGFLDKAKQKILLFDSTSCSMSAFAECQVSKTKALSVTPSTEILKRKEKVSTVRSDAHGHNQELGVWRSHTEYFLQCRMPCVNDVAVETNNLIIRLDKLINHCPDDAARRKDFERSIVPWTADSQAHECRCCRIKFSFKKRKHHCRLCGKIICHSCSKFLPFVTARKLTNPAFAAGLLLETGRFEKSSADDHGTSETMSSLGISKFAKAGDSIQQMKKKSEKILSTTLSLVKGDGAEVSLSSLLLQDENEHLRICESCKILLDVRDEKMDQAASPPMITILYDRLCNLSDELHRLIPSYSRMADSLRRGESIYSLESAKQLRQKLFQLHKEIDVVSEKIENLGLGDVSKNTNTRESILQKNIRYLAVQNLQETMHQMTQLPTADEFALLQEKRRSEIQRQVEKERQALLMVVKNSPSSSDIDDFLRSSSSSKNTDVKPNLKASVSFAGISTSRAFVDSGWTPSCTPQLSLNPFLDDEEINPIEQQVSIIKGYLKQAVEDGRIEEVNILEGNLNDLENELKRMKVSSNS